VLRRTGLYAPLPQSLEVSRSLSKPVGPSGRALVTNIRRSQKATYLQIDERNDGNVSENSAFLTRRCTSAATPCHKRH